MRIMKCYQADSKRRPLEAAV